MRPQAALHKLDTLIAELRVFRGGLEAPFQRFARGSRPSHFHLTVQPTGGVSRTSGSRPSSTASRASRR